MHGLLYNHSLGVLHDSQGVVYWRYCRECLFGRRIGGDDFDERADSTEQKKGIGERTQTATQLRVTNRRLEKSAECNREYEPQPSNCIHRIGMGGVCDECEREPVTTTAAARAELANAATTEICDYCGVDTNDAERVAEIIMRNCFPATGVEAGGDEPVTVVHVPVDDEDAAALRNQGEGEGK